MIVSQWCRRNLALAEDKEREKLKLQMDEDDNGSSSNTKLTASLPNLFTDKTEEEKNQYFIDNLVGRKLFFHTDDQELYIQVSDFLKHTLGIQVLDPTEIQKSWIEGSGLHRTVGIADAQPGGESPKQLAQEEIKKERKRREEEKEQREKERELHARRTAAAPSCRFFAKGSCTRGFQCRFSHSTGGASGASGASDASGTSGSVNGVKKKSDSAAGNNTLGTRWV